jgi:chromosome segregation ATPase
MTEFVQQTPDRSYTDYLKEAGEDNEDLKRLDTSGSSAGEILAMAMTTPHSSIPSGIISPQLTESRSFVNGLLSPFSPLLKEKEQRGEFLQYVSLQPCRKVSIVVRVLPTGDNDDEQRCLFPQIRGDANPMSIIQKPNPPRDMVVVNPAAFGTHIPSRVTMETARLVAQVAKKSCEDWYVVSPKKRNPSPFVQYSLTHPNACESRARLYEFHHIMWPTSQDIADGEETSDHFSTMDSLSRAVAQDAMVELQSSLVISLGQTSSCIGDGDSMWTRVISQCQGLMEEKTVCKMSLVEVLEDRDSFRDLLNSDNKDVAMRHVDMKGAILENLSQVPIDSMPGLLESLSKRKRSNSTVFGTISLWDNAISYELKKSPSSQITCVEMAAMPQNSGDTQIKSEDTAVHQKGTVSLGRALRQLLLHATVGTEPVISYRETTLTKVLQRALESSKIVMLASVSQLSKDYEFTLATLNYLRRLLVKPGTTASSPFKSETLIDKQQSPLRPQEYGDTISISSHSKLHEYANGPYLLEQIVADPRQRLAKIFKQSPAPKDAIPIDFAPSEEEYRPIDYMDYDQWGEESRLQIPELVEENDRMDADGGFLDESVTKLSEAIDESYDSEKNNDNYHRQREEDGEVRSLRNDTDGGITHLGVDRSFDEDAISYEVSFDPDGNRFRDENAGELAALKIYPGDQNHDQRSEETESPLRKYVGELVGGGREVGTGEISINDLSKDLISDGHKSDIAYNSEFDATEQLNTYEWNSDQSDDDVDLGLQPQPQYESPERNLSIDNSNGQQSAVFSASYPSESINERTFSSSPLSQKFLSSGGRHTGGTSSDSGSFEEHRVNASSPEGVPVQKPAVEIYTDESDESTGNEKLPFSNSDARLNISSYDGEIDVLEGAVKQIQTMHKGLWESSATSLTRLKESLRSQHASLKSVSEEKEELRSTIASLKDEVKRVSEEHDEHIQSYEAEVQQSHDRLDQALNDKIDVERIADEAISSQAGIENQLKAAHDGLFRARQDVETIQNEKLFMVKVQEDLRAELSDMKQQLQLTENQKKQKETLQLDLERSIEHLKRDRGRLENKIGDHDSLIEDLRNQLRRNEKSVYDLQKEKEQLEVLRRDEKLQLEGLENQSRHFGMSLDNMEKERSHLEGLRRRDISTIQTLRDDLRETEIAGVDLKSELAKRGEALSDGQDKVRHLETDCQHLQTRIESLERDCEHLQKLRTEERSESDAVRQKVLQFSQSFEDIESERARTEQLRRDAEATILNLENELTREKERRAKAERKQLEETSNLKNLAGQMKMDSDLKEGELERYKHEVQDLKEKLSLSQERGRNLSTNVDNKVLHLRGRLDDYKAELELRHKQKEGLIEKLDSAEKQEKNFNRRLQALNEALERYRLDSLQAKEEVSQLRDLGRSQATDSNQQIAKYEKQISMLQDELSITKRQRDLAQNSSNKTSLTHGTLSEELTRAKELLNQRNNDVERLSSDLEKDRSEKQRLEESMLRMTSDLQRFQLETKEKVGKVVNYHKDSGQELQKLRSRNLELEAKIQSLEEITEQLQHERDACFRSLEMGRDKIASISFKAGTGETNDEVKSRHTEDVVYKNRKVGRESRVVPELYLTNYSIDQMLSLRAEEIAACLAVSAKHSLQESHDEAFHLRSKVFRLEEEKGAEVSSLKARIRFLESELVHVEVSKEPSMYSRQRRYVIDATD